MINIIDYTIPEDEEYIEVPEIELELVEVPDKNAIVLIPGDKKYKVQEIVSSVAILKDVLCTFSAKKYPQYTIYTIHGDTEYKEVYAFPNNTSYGNIKKVMEGVLQAHNIVGDCSGKVLVGIRI